MNKLIIPEFQDTKAIFINCGMYNKEYFFDNSENFLSPFCKPIVISIKGKSHSNMIKMLLSVLNSYKFDLILNLGKKIEINNNTVNDFYNYSHKLNLLKNKMNTCIIINYENNSQFDNELFWKNLNNYVDKCVILICHTEFVNLYARNFMNRYRELMYYEK